MIHDQVAQLYCEGVEAIRKATVSIGADGWSRPACGKWNADDTARHLLAVARWYGEWLDRALAGNTSPPFSESDIDKQNDVRIAALRDLDGPSAVAQFTETALAYLERVPQYWDLPYAYPFGTVTPGLHLGVAATEWHLHAFDLASANGRTHEPKDASALFTAAGLCIAESKPRLQRAVLHRLIPIGARSKPWQRLLRESGRSHSHPGQGPGESTAR